MGTSLGNLHVYKGKQEEVKEALHQGEYVVADISKEWTSVFCREFRDGDTEKAAKGLSKTLAEPILSFQYFDDDIISLVLFKEGRISAQFRMAYTGDPYLKNCRNFISELGFDTSQEKRLRTIFKCSDLERKVELLEEFFGVKLYLDIDFMQEAISSFVLKRDNVLYLEYEKQLKELKKIKNITKAVLTQEINGKMARFDARPFIMAQQGDDGAYDQDECIICDVIDDELIRLYKKAKVVGGGDIPETVSGNNILIVYFHFYTDGPRCWRLDKDGAIIGITPFPDSNIKITAVLENGDLICYAGDYGAGQNIMRVDFYGKIIWNVTLDTDDIWIEPVLHEEYIYLGSRDDEDGELFKLDLSGNIVARKRLSYIHSHSELLFVNGAVYYLGDYYGDKYSQEVFIKMDESFECIEKITLPKEISIFSDAVLDRKNMVAYYNALDHRIIAIDMKSMQYRANKMDFEIYLRETDENGFIYGSSVGSTVYVLDAEMKIQSKHRLKGDVYDIFKTRTGMHAVTGTGDTSFWGYPENCLVRVYRIDFI